MTLKKESVPKPRTAPFTVPRPEFDLDERTAGPFRLYPLSGELLIAGQLACQALIAGMLLPTKARPLRFFGADSLGGDNFTRHRNDPASQRIEV